MHGNARAWRQPPHTTLVPLLVADDFMDDLVGRTWFCCNFRIDARGDGTYDMTVMGDSASFRTLDAERQFEGDA